MEIRLIGLDNDELEKAIESAQQGDLSDIGVKSVDAVAYCRGYTSPLAKKFSDKLHPPSILVESEKGYLWVPVKCEVRRVAKGALTNLECTYCKAYKAKEDFNPEELI